MIRPTRFTLTAVTLALAAVVALPLPAHAQPGSGGVVPDHQQPKPKGFRPEAGITEQIGGQVPLDLTFRDENDQPITLGDAMAGKPTILVPVYYKCPMLCTEVLNGLLKALREMPNDFTAGNQFNVVTVSMDPKEHGDLARAKKKAYLHDQGGYGRAGADEGWRFLTGTKESIAGLLDAVGYRFEFDKMLKEFNHPSGIIILSPQGKVTRYFYGIGYDEEYKLAGDKVQKNGVLTQPTTTLRLSLIEAADGKDGSLLDKLRLMCYSYDQMNHGYSPNVMRLVQLGGIVTLMLVCAGVLLAVRREGVLGSLLMRAILFLVIFTWVGGAYISSVVAKGSDFAVVLGLLSLGCSIAIGVTLLVFRRTHPAAPSVATSEPHAITGGTV